MKNRKKKAVDPIPEEFSSYEEAAEFWDSHSTADYPEAFETVEVEVELKSRQYEVEIDEDVIAVLREQAKKQGVTLKRLVSDLLRKQLPPAA
jgi:hypothetical protein